MKLIHCADLRLDAAPEPAMTSAQAAERNAEIIGSFSRLTEYARKNNVRVVLISGGLFDSRRYQTRTVDEVLNAIRRTPRVEYFYLPGNQDDCPAIFADRELPQNLHQFSRQWSSFRLDTTVISGIEISRANATALYQRVPRIEGCTNIVMMYGEAGSECGMGRVNLDLLRNKGIDYLALGSSPDFRQEPLDQKGILCYPGSPEGHSFAECGRKGFVLMDVTAGRLTTEFVPFAGRTLHSVTVDVTGMMKNSEIVQRMRSRARAIPHEDMVEFILTGESAPAAPISADRLNTLIRQDFYFTRVRDNTRMLLTPEAYENDISLKGEYIRLILASAYTDEEKAAMIRIGMEALAGEEVVL